MAHIMLQIVIAGLWDALSLTQRAEKARRKPDRGDDEAPVRKQMGIVNFAK